MSLFDDFIKTIPSGAADCLITFQKIIDFISPKLGTDAVSLTNTKWFQNLSKFVPLFTFVYLFILLPLPFFLIHFFNSGNFNKVAEVICFTTMAGSGLLLLVSLIEIVRYSFYALVFKVLKRDPRVFFIMMGIIPLKSFPFYIIAWTLFSIFA